MAFDLQNIEGQENDLSNTDQTACRRRQESLSGLFAKRRLEVGSIVLGQVVAGYRLATVLVYPLQNLVSCRISQTGKQRNELLAGARIGFILEDNGVELGNVVDLDGKARLAVALWLQAVNWICTLDSLLIRRFAMVSTCQRLGFGVAAGALSIGSNAQGGRQPIQRYQQSLW